MKSITAFKGNSEYGPAIRTVSANYIVNLVGNMDGRLEDIPYFMEDARKHFCSLAGFTPPRRMPLSEVFVFTTRELWQTFLKNNVPGWTHKAIIETSEAIYSATGFAVRGASILYDIGGLETFRIAAHEGMHQFLQRLERSNRLSVPLWAHEGLAVAAEGFVIVDGLPQFDITANPERLQDLRRVVHDVAILPLGSLLTTSDALCDTPDINLRPCLWAMQRLIDSVPNYSASQSHMIQDAAAGKIESPSTRVRQCELGIELFRRYISDDLPAFESELKQFAESIVRQSEEVIQA